MIDIPGDLSVAGFDNIQEAWQLTPPLASVDVPRVDMAIAAVELLIKSMNNPLSVHELILLNPILVIRDSLSAVPRHQPLTPHVTADAARAHPISATDGFARTSVSPGKE